MWFISGLVETFEAPKTYSTTVPLVIVSILAVIFGVIFLKASASSSHTPFGIHNITSAFGEAEPGSTYYDYAKSLIADAKQIIAQGAYRNNDKHLTEDAIRARGLSNRRIGKVSGLLNAFTTTDLNVRTKFKLKAIEKLKHAAWTELVSAARLSLKNAIDAAEQSTSDGCTTVQHFVRHLTFTVALQVLFGVAAQHLDHEAVGNATDEINRLWLLAKDKKLEDLTAFEDNHVLRRALCKLLPGETSGTAISTLSISSSQPTKLSGALYCLAISNVPTTSSHLRATTAAAPT